MNYSTIKSKRKSGEAITILAISEALADQRAVLATAGDAVAKAFAAIHAAETGETKGALLKALAVHQQAIRRLAKLHGWHGKLLAEHPIKDVEIPDTFPSDLDEDNPSPASDIW